MYTSQLSKAHKDLPKMFKTQNLCVRSWCCHWICNQVLWPEHQVTEGQQLGTLHLLFLFSLCLCLCFWLCLSVCPSLSDCSTITMIYLEYLIQLGWWPPSSSKGITLRLTGILQFLCLHLYFLPAIPIISKFCHWFSLFSINVSSLVILCQSKLLISLSINN